MELRRKLPENMWNICLKEGIIRTFRLVRALTTARGEVSGLREALNPEGLAPGLLRPAAIRPKHCSPPRKPRSRQCIAGRPRRAPFCWEGEFFFSARRPREPERAGYLAGRLRAPLPPAAWDRATAAAQLLRAFSPRAGAFGPRPRTFPFLGGPPCSLRKPSTAPPAQLTRLPSHI